MWVCYFFSLEKSIYKGKLTSNRYFFIATQLCVSKGGSVLDLGFLGGGVVNLDVFSLRVGGQLGKIYPRRGGSA